ncbi:MAG: ribonuclease HII [Pseudomonadota bacterium]
MSARIAGVDEAGRGCLAGPVAVAAVILDPAADWSEVDDSKRLTLKKREALAHTIRAGCLSWHVELVDVATIDRVNILNATLLGMRRCVEALPVAASEVLIDGNRTPDLALPCRAIIGGDRLEKCIGAASILAKTARDNFMIEMDQKYPEYGFADHKGYGTAQHLKALRALGPTPLHRTSFAPVQDLAQGDLFSA